MISDNPKLPQFGPEDHTDVVGRPFWARFQERFYTLWRELADAVEKMVQGPTSSTDNQVARFDGTSGRLIQGSDVTITDDGIITVAGLARRIRGDFSNATLSNRLIFQTSTTNDGGGVFFMPNGTGGYAGLVCCAASNPDNTAILELSSNAAAQTVNINAGKVGTGSYYPLVITAGGYECARMATNGRALIAGSTDNGAYNLQCNGTGVWGAGAYTNGSDARIKQDVTPIASGMDVIVKLNPVQFRYKADWSQDQSLQPGFIAQELVTALEGKEYADGVVQQGSQYLSVAYQSLIPILVKAVQELKTEFDAYKAAHP